MHIMLHIYNKTFYNKLANGYFLWIYRHGGKIKSSTIYKADFIESSMRNVCIN